MYYQNWSKLGLEQPQYIGSDIDLLLKQHYFNGTFFNAEMMASLAQSFQKESYVKVQSFLPSIIMDMIKREVYDLLDQYAVRREMFMKVTSNTPRFLSNVRSSDIAQSGKFIPALYHSEVLTSFISKIFGERAITCPYENERFMILRLTKAGDTHGWHWDDYAFSLIVIIECPLPEIGGTVEFIPNTIWDKKNPNIVNYHLSHRTVQARSHVAGDVYLLRGDTAMHRVTPLKEDALRIVLNLAWANEDDLYKEVSHETLDDLYA